jgi:DNA-binding Xre family transcriptional regulator
MKYMTRPETVGMLNIMPELRWRLKEFLEEHEISAYSLAKDSSLSLPSVYRLTNNHSRYIQFDTLETIVATLERKTGKSIQLTDLLEFQEEKSPK